MRVWEGPKNSVVVRITEREAWTELRSARYRVLEAIETHIRARGPDRRLYRQPTCVRCGCIESNACEGGCSWIELNKNTSAGICSSCVQTSAKAAKA